MLMLGSLISPSRKCIHVEAISPERQFERKPAGASSDKAHHNRQLIQRLSSRRPSCESRASIINCRRYAFAVLPTRALVASEFSRLARAGLGLYRPSLQLFFAITSSRTSQQHHAAVARRTAALAEIARVLDTIDDAHTNCRERHR
jgi:hypothetical protein